MSSAVTAAAPSHRGADLDVAQERELLRHGTAEQRRHFLRMRLLPLPDDLEAVAVPGTAILDLPASSTATTVINNASAAAPDVADHNAARLSHTTRFDPLQHIAARYGVGRDEQADEEANDVDDCTDFIEVLCPDGSSLLEMLPLTRSPTNQSPARPSAHISNSPPRRFDGACEPQNTELPDSPDQLLSTDTPQTVHVDAPILFPVSQSLSDFTTPEISTIRPQQENGSRTEAELMPRKLSQYPEIFVSVGCCFVPSPRSSRHRHVTPSSRHSPASYQHTCRTVRSVSSERMSSQGRSGATTPSAVCSAPTSPTTSAPRSPFTVFETCDVAGRILLTDRLVQSQAHTALPTVMKAYQQYLEASAAASAASASAFSESSHKHSRHRYHASNVLSSKEQFDTAQQRLAPRQRGIVLQCSNTDPEVMKCVAQAVSCQRPSFRQIDPADRYGSSCYISGAFIKKT